MPTTHARPAANLTISFGLVAIPVNLYPAAISSEKLSFNFLRGKDGSRLKQRYVALNDGKVVERADLTKGYEFAKDQYVMFSPKELKALEDMTTHTIDISQFVPLASVDPIYYDGTYYLVPDKGGAKPYSLLTDALAGTKQCAVGRWISRGKEHLVMIRSIRGGLAMHQLHFQAEVRQIKDLRVEAADIPAAELKLADQLITQLSAAKFDPTLYVDEFHKRVEAAVQRKVQGKEISIAEPPAAPDRGNVVDLMQALKSSLDLRGRKPITIKERRTPRRAAVDRPRKSARR